MPRQSPEGVPVVVRRFTARGICLIALSLGMFLMAVHFSNNILFLISFLMLSLVVIAVITQGRALTGVRTHLIPPPIVEAGSPAKIRFTADQPAAGLQIQTPLGTALPEGESLVLEKTSTVRGCYPIGPARLMARDPFGLFQATRDLSSAEASPDAALAVYPAPDWAAPAPAGTLENRVATGRVRGEVASLRPYREGDSPGDISWRHTARADGFMVKEYEADPRQSARHYLWGSVAARGIEPALSALSAAVLAGARDGVDVGLDLPGRSIAAGRGNAHVNDLMVALAAFRGRT